MDLLYPSVTHMIVMALYHSGYLLPWITIYSREREGIRFVWLLQWVEFQPGRIVCSVKLALPFRSSPSGRLLARTLLSLALNGRVAVLSSSVRTLPSRKRDLKRRWPMGYFRVIEILILNFVEQCSKFSYFRPECGGNFLTAVLIWRSLRTGQWPMLGWASMPSKFK